MDPERNIYITDGVSLFVIYDSRQHLWWLDGCKGYTASLIEAGVYTEEDLKHANTEPPRDEIIALSEALDVIAQQNADGQRVIDHLTRTRAVE